jgi:hypothetical protein
MRATKPIKLTSEGLYVNSTALIFLLFHRFGGWDFSARLSTCALKDCCKKLQLVLDFSVKKASIELSPPIQFRIEWAGSQGMSPLLGRRPI